MRYLFIVITIELLLAALSVVVLYKTPPLYFVYVSISVAVMILAALLYHRLGIPIKKITTGMELLAAQDFSSQLRPTGQKDTDKIIGVFNSMMKQLRNQVLMNQEQNFFLKQLIDASPMGVITLDFNEQIDMFNSAAVKMLKTDKNTILKTKQLSDIDSELTKYLSELDFCDSKIIRMSNTDRYKCSCLFFMDRGFKRKFYLIESLTEEIRKAEREAYGKVIRTIAHEVNNSMAATKAVLDITETVIADDPDIVETLECCKNRINSMTNFITQYANVVKTPPMHCIPQNINALINNNISFYEAMCIGTNVKIKSQLSTTPITANIDSAMFEQVLVNIIKNAIESCNGIGEVQILTIDKQLIIADNGKGIQTKEAQNLFNPFYSTKPNGQGIGLMFAADTLRRHGFEFSLATNPVDGITRFTISLEPSMHPQI
ncbi:ATP-binding protein [uncultured Muribaculum sp.]|uniref:sensor histidine kinase n=2 Tax=uncultured Muribaculum sp. TaxID=1918613 RepID=UPI0025B0A22D|nr:ATP-binding protein [uncultured Muribaculum sp.]